MTAQRLTGSAKDCIAKVAPNPHIQFAQLQPILGFFNSIRREFTGVNRIQLRIEGSYVEGNFFLYREWDGMVFALRKIMITMFFFFFLSLFNFFSVPGLFFPPPRLLQVVPHAGFGCLCDTTWQGHWTLDP